MKKRLGVDSSLPFLTKILNALGSEQLLDLDLIRWKEGSGLSSSAQLSHAPRGISIIRLLFPFPHLPRFLQGEEKRGRGAGTSLMGPELQHLVG